MNCVRIHRPLPVSVALLLERHVVCVTRPVKAQWYCDTHFFIRGINTAEFQTVTHFEVTKHPHFHQGSMIGEASGAFPWMER